MSLAALGATLLSGAVTRPARAQPGRGRRLNIYSWEGYGSAALLDPFRDEFNCRIGTQTLTSDPEAVNRLRGGEAEIWDLIAVNGPWQRAVLLPEKLILPLDESRYEAFLDRVQPLAAESLHRASQAYDGALLGLPQRFCPVGFVVNTDRISRGEAEDLGLALFLDPALKGRYVLLAYDSWNVTQICIAAGIDPFRPHDPTELEIFAETARRILTGARWMSTDMDAINKALAAGEIDACFTGGRYSVATARFAGARHLRAITPRSGPMNGNGGVLWVEIASVVNNPNVSPLAYDFLDYVQRPEAARHMALAKRTFNPVAQMGDPHIFAQFSNAELDALQWEELEEDLSRCADHGINPDYVQMLEIYNGAKRLRA